MTTKQVLSKRHLHLVAIAGALLTVLTVGCTSYTEPVWTSVAKLEGKSYVTDGDFAIDMKLIKITQPPNMQSTNKWFSDSLFENLRSDTKEQFNLDDIHASSGNPEIVVGPGDLQLEEKYITYLTGRLSSDHRVAFWQLSASEPVVIVVDGVAVGAMKALN